MTGDLKKVTNQYVNLKRKKGVHDQFEFSGTSYIGWFIIGYSKIIYKKNKPDKSLIIRQIDLYGCISTI